MVVVVAAVMEILAPMISLVKVFKHSLLEQIMRRTIGRIWDQRKVNQNDPDLWNGVRSKIIHYQ